MLVHPGGGVAFGTSVKAEVLAEEVTKQIKDEEIEETISITYFR